MQISLKWINELVNIKIITLDNLIEKLTLGEFEVEEILELKINNEKQLALDISATANRSDSLSIQGISSEIASLLDFSDIWEEKITQDPRLVALIKTEATALQNIKVEKQKSLPDITIGYNNQGISGNRISGVLGGITIPLWNSSNNVKAAKINYDFHVAHTVSELSRHEAIYFEQYNNYKLLKEKYSKYKETISGD